MSSDNAIFVTISMASMYISIIIYPLKNISITQHILICFIIIITTIEE